jgi:2-oxoglutarate/2-oxoacid ferredoxin oxidoreductase subunit alpha
VTTTQTAERELMEGSEALARAAVVAGCRFFAGYPMTPFTEVLEHFAKLLPEAGGVCINAESELEAVGMTWGALATGARAATGSTGQGLSLMQESFSEITLAELPLVVFNMARGQQDYYQATRGGGHGDYRHIVLAPQDVTEGVELVQLAFHLADKWRNPALLYGDYLLAHTYEALTIEPMQFPELPPKDWAVDGTLSGSGASRSVTPLGVGKVGQTALGQAALGQEGKAQYIATKIPLMEREVRVETGFLDDAETVVVAFGSPAKFVKYAVRRLRAAGHRIGYVRPITLWPFPYATVADAASGPSVRRMGSFELSAGQMIDDVRIGVAGRAPVSFIGGVSTDHSGFGVGRLLDVDIVGERLLALHEDREQPVIPGYEVNSYALATHQAEATR